MTERGRVSGQLQVIVPIRVGSPTGPVQTIRAVLDTGFGGFLALPARLVEELQLPFIDFVTVRPADGQLMQCAEHIGRVEWMGTLAEISVLSMEGGPLLGMELIRGCRVSLEVVPGGAVEISCV